MFRLFITHIKAVMLSCILFLMFGDEKRRPLNTYWQWMFKYEFDFSIGSLGFI
jgi:hypothetical protein